MSISRSYEDGFATAKTPTSESLDCKRWTHKRNRKLCLRLRCLVFTKYASDYDSDSDSAASENQFLDNVRLHWNERLINNACSIKLTKSLILLFRITGLL